MASQKVIESLGGYGRRSIVAFLQATQVALIPIRCFSMLLSIHLPPYPKFRLHSDFVFNLIHSLLTTELDIALIAWPPE